MDMNSASPASPRLLFEAVVRPHRSLSGRQMLMALGVMAVVSLCVTSLMFLLGAWPVIGFNGADLALAALLFWLNVRAARAREVITLSEDALAVTRTDANGRRLAFHLAPYWLNVVLEERAGTVPKMLLAARGTTLEVARQLGEDQKRDLAAALTGALHRWRNPRFDNPQLRGE
jgi:uncharacterized membrane protein